MQTIYRLNVNELNSQFIETLKMLFKDKEIEIIVSEVDETTYLLQSQTNKKRLLQSIANIETQQNLIAVAQDVPFQ